MTRSCGPVGRPSPVQPASFRRRCTRLGSVHNRSEFIKNWYESVRPWFLLRSSLPGSYANARRLDVSCVTLFVFCRRVFVVAPTERLEAACPAGPAPLHQRQLPPNPAPKGAQAREGRAYGPTVHLSHAGADQGLPGQPEGLGERAPVILS